MLLIVAENAQTSPIRLVGVLNCTGVLQEAMTNAAIVTTVGTMEVAMIFIMVALLTTIKVFLTRSKIEIRGCGY
jgi:hypothetical protein